MAANQNTTDDEALAILRRLEPALTGLANRMAGLETRMTGLEARMGALEVGVAELRGKVSQIPTWWQMLTIIAGLILAVMGGTIGVLALSGGMR